MPCPNTGEPSAGDQTVARGVGGIVAVGLANVFHARGIAHQQRQALDQLRAILCDDPAIRFQQLVHQLPATDAVVVGRGGARQAVHGEHVAELLGDRRFRGAMRESIRREENFADLLAAGAFGNGLRQHARREAVLHEFAISNNT